MMLRKQITPQQALVRLETACAKTEYAVFEIATKLKNWGIGSNDAEKILDSLIDRKFLDNQRFATAYIRDKYRFCKWGRRKICVGLYQKHISQDVINEALATIDEEEYFEILVAFLSSKTRTIKSDSPAELRTKLFRAALSRGYETSLAAKAVKIICSTYMTT